MARRHGVKFVFNLKTSENFTLNDSLVSSAVGAVFFAHKQNVYIIDGHTIQ